MAYTHVFFPGVAAGDESPLLTPTRGAINCLLTCAQCHRPNATSLCRECGCAWCATCDEYGTPGSVSPEDISPSGAGTPFTSSFFYVICAPCHAAIEARLRKEPGVRYKSAHPTTGALIPSLRLLSSDLKKTPLKTCEVHSVSASATEAEAGADAGAGAGAGEEKEKEKPPRRRKQDTPAQRDPSQPLRRSARTSLLSSGKP